MTADPHIDSTACDAVPGRRGPRGATRLLATSVLLLAAAAAALAIDIPVGRWCREHYDAASAARSRTNNRWLEAVGRVLQTAEPFGHGLGIVLVAIGIFQLDPARRWGIPRLVTIAAGAGLAVDVLKVLVERTRPHHFDFAGSVWSTFGDWLPLGRVGSTGQSLPSGHTATAVALAIALVWLYPRGRSLFPALAALVACQRVITGAHWPSDVLAGAFVGCLFALFCLEVGPAASAFGRWETRWKARCPYPPRSAQGA